MGDEALPGELLDRVQSLSAAVDGLPDPRARELAQELVSAVIAMYGDGLRRIMAAIVEAREAGATILDELAQDGAVASLLLIHDLYPVSLEERVIEALDTVRPYMESHGGNVELLSIEDGVAELELQGSCHGCAASRATLELAIKQALDEHCPDLIGVEVQGVTEEPALGANGRALPMLDGPATGGFELPVIHSGAAPRWLPLERAGELEPGRLSVLSADGTSMVLANVSGTLLAYRDQCASCGETLADAALQEGMLRCSSCGADFDLRRAGRAAGGEPLQLTPVPLLQDGGVRVAV